MNDSRAFPANNKSALRWSKQMLYCFQPDVPRVNALPIGDASLLVRAASVQVAAVWAAAVGA